MKIVADENIPYLEHYFGVNNQLILKSGRTITHDDLIDADILLVRSVTQVNQSLLEKTAVKFVGTATIGLDHIDTEWLQQAGIQWASAKGCNARAVVEYVISVVAALQRGGQLLNFKKRAGVIGVGHIGEEVVHKLKIMGFNDIIQYDPLRKDQDAFFESASLDDFYDLDFITLHTPLTYNGSYPTFHMLEKNFLQRQKQGCIILNTGRGSVIDFAALKTYGRHLLWCLDVWENEPLIDLEVLKAAFIATPHIAGYSMQSKLRSIEMLYKALLQNKMISKKPSLAYPSKNISFPTSLLDWREAALTIYDPLTTTQTMKTALLHGTHTFDYLRKHFIERTEFNYIQPKEILFQDETNHRVWLQLVE